MPGHAPHSSGGRSEVPAPAAQLVVALADAWVAFPAGEARPVLRHAQSLAVLRELPGPRDSAAPPW